MNPYPDLIPHLVNADIYIGWLDYTLQLSRVVSWLTVGCIGLLAYAVAKALNLIGR